MGATVPLLSLSFFELLGPHVPSSSNVTYIYINSYIFGVVKPGVRRSQQFFLPKHNIKVKGLSVSWYRHQVNDLNLQPGPPGILGGPGERFSMVTGSVDGH